MDCLKDWLEANYPPNTVYRFPDCYKGLHNHALLHQKLLVAAEISSCKICLRSSMKDKNKLFFVCNHGRVYDERFGKEKPEEISMKRSTKTHRSLQKNYCCPFSFSIFHCSDDDHWYLSNYPKRCVLR